MNTCATCKYWTKNQDSGLKDDYGACVRLNTDTWGWDTVLEPMPDDEENPRPMITPLGFGCNQHEPKAEQA